MATARQLEYRKFLNSEAWAKIRCDIIMLRGSRCEVCQVDKKVVNVHHLNYDKPWGEEEDNDLIVLCRECHTTEHGIKNKKKKTRKKSKQDRKVARKDRRHKKKTKPKWKQAQPYKCKMTIEELRAKSRAMDLKGS
ncbi:MAG: hypothetical protein P1P89_22245 [Desulfobacterales bacterium]|nr:hypothetical protein [Desulfobacterales bacterium]